MVGQPSVAAASWPVCVLAVTLAAGAACAPDPEQLRAQRTIDAEYDIETGRLALITFGSDDNGTVDTWSYIDGNTVLQIEIDQNEDGVVERWNYYVGDRILETVGSSRGGERAPARRRSPDLAPPSLVSVQACHATA